MKFKLWSAVTSLMLMAYFNVHANGANQQAQTQQILHDYISIKTMSKILREERELLVHLPDDYASNNNTYPVIYLLDGKRHFAHAIIAEEMLQKESLIPSSIIVAITNNRGKRGRDLSAEKDKFLNFIEQEVVPLINENYRNNQIKTLFGHSMAGAFTLDVLASSPGLFQNYITASPVIQIRNAELLAKFTDYQFQDAKLNRSLFMSFGNDAAEGKMATKAFNDFISLMQTNTITGLDWRHQIMPQQVHMTTPYLTLYAGLSHVFIDFQVPSYSGVNDYNSRGGMKGLLAHFQKRAHKYGVSKQIPEVAFRRLGFAIFDDGDHESGLNILKQNVNSHPESLRAINALAQAYEDAGLNKDALLTYEQGLALAEKLASGNTAHFKRQIERLSQGVS